MNLTAFFKCFFKVSADISDRIGTDHECTVFKVQIEGTVVKIDGTDGCTDIITQEYLCVDKSRLIFIDLHTCFKQLRIIGTTDIPYDFFIRYTWHDDAHVYTFSSSMDQRIDHF